LRQESKLKTP